jgi:outer membrane protein, multidrug efflux system
MNVMPKFHLRRSPLRAMRLSAGAVIVMLLASCASMAPSYQVPVLPVSPAYATDDAQQGASAAAIGWRDYFTDPQLQTLIRLALDNNRDLRSAVLRVEEARATYGIQRAERFPAILARADESRSRTPADLSMTGKPLIASQYQVDLGVTSWEIDFWGRVRSLQDAALENYLSTDAARRAAALALVTEVANTYITLREFDERIELAHQATASREESYRIFTRRVEVGSTSRFNLTEVQTLLTQAQALGAELEEARAIKFNALTLLVGAPAALSPGQGQFDETNTLRELRPGLPSDLLTHRPDIATAEHQLKASNANIGAARAAFFPRIALTGSAGTASAELAGLFSSGSLAWTFLPSISLPIFDGGRTRNNLSLAEVRRDLAVANYEKTVQIAFRDVSDALSSRRWLERQLAIARTALATQTERARLAKLRYASGASAFLDVLDAQRDLLAVAQQLVQTRRALLTNRVRLYAALGGGAMDFVALPDAGPANPTRDKNAP